MFTSFNSNFSSTEQLWLSHVLQTKTFCHNSRLTCLATSEQRRWTHLRHFVHWIELQPTRSLQTPQGPTFETNTFFLNNNCIRFVLSTSTLRPFPFTAFFYLPYLPITSFNSIGASDRSFYPIFNKRFDHLETLLTMQTPKKCCQLGHCAGLQCLVPSLNAPKGPLYYPHSIMLQFQICYHSYLNAS